MSTPDIFERLRTAGIAISRRGDSLWVSPESAVTPELLIELRAHKAELLATVDDLTRAFRAYGRRHGFSADDEARDLPPMFRDPRSWLAYLRAQQQGRS